MMINKMGNKTKKMHTTQIMFIFNYLTVVPVYGFKTVQVKRRISIFVLTFKTQRYFQSDELLQVLCFNLKPHKRNRLKPIGPGCTCVFTSSANIPFKILPELYKDLLGFVINTKENLSKIWDY